MQTALIPDGEVQLRPLLDLMSPSRFTTCSNCSLMFVFMTILVRTNMVYVCVFGYSVPTRYNAHHPNTQLVSPGCD